MAFDPYALPESVQNKLGLTPERKKKLADAAVGAAGKVLQYASPVAAGYQGAPLRALAPDSEAAKTATAADMVANPQRLAGAAASEAKDLRKPHELAPKGGGEGEDQAADIITADEAPAPGGPSGGGGGGGPAMLPERELWRVGPQVRGAFDQADAATEKAIRDRAEAEGQQGVGEQSEIYQEQLAEEQRAQKTEQAEKSRQAVLKSYQEQADQLANEASASHVDANRYFKNESTFDKITRVIGMALGGGLQAAGRGNPAADAINAAIARDIDEQKTNIALKGQASERARGLFGVAMQRFGDERAAEEATHRAYLTIAEKKLQRLALGSKNVQVQQRAEDLLAQLQEQKAQRLNQMLQYAPAGPAGGGGVGTGFLAGGNPDAYIDLGNGSGIMARSAPEAEKLRDLQGRSAQVVDALGQLKAMDASASTVEKANPLSEYNRKRGSLIAQTEQNLTVLQGQGAMSKGDQEVAQNALGALSGMGKFANNASVYDQAAHTVQHGVQNRLASQAGMQVKEVYVQNRKGEVERKYVPVGGAYTGPAPAPAMPGKVRGQK